MALVKHKISAYSPMRVIFLSYIAVIFLGSILLCLPVSQNGQTPPLSFGDCFFTSASSVCVTGLVVVPTAVHWTFFGQLVILVLIQIGGLSMITVAGFIFIVTGRKLGFRNRLLLQNSFNHTQMGGMVKFVKTVIKGTALFELSGAVLLSLYFCVFKDMGLGKAAYNGIFHAVSAFCNAGFDVLGTNSLMDYSGDVYVNVVIMILILVGGIGFFVWQDVVKRLRDKRHRLSVTTKLAMFTTLFLFCAGGAYFFFAEYNNPETIGNFPVWHKILASVFQSATLRTAGFASINQTGLKEASKFVSSILMMIGGSPGGMAGGMKTVTIAVIFSSIWSIVRGREGIRVLNRSISLKTLQKALAVSGIMIMLLFAFTAVLCVLEANSPAADSFIDIMYECASALSTAGVPMGITPHLLVSSKIILIAGMIIGRVGPITVIYALTHTDTSVMQYPEEQVLIG